MILKNIKKLKKLLENYDKIMVMIDVKNEESKKKDKRYSSFNTPKSQLDAIARLQKGA